MDKFNLEDEVAKFRNTMLKYDELLKACEEEGSQESFTLASMISIWCSAVKKGTIRELIYEIGGVISRMEKVKPRFFFDNETGEVLKIN